MKDLIGRVNELAEEMNINKIDMTRAYQVASNKVLAKYGCNSQAYGMPREIMINLMTKKDDVIYKLCRLYFKYGLPKEDEE